MFLQTFVYIKGLQHSLHGPQHGDIIGIFIRRFLITWRHE